MVSTCTAPYSCLTVNYLMLNFTTVFWHDVPMTQWPKRDHVLYSCVVVDPFRSAASVALKNKILTPDMLNQRKKLYTAAISLSKKRILSFKCFIQVLLTLLARDMGFRSTYKELLSAMDTLSKFKPSRSFLVQSLDKYLVCFSSEVL